MTYAEKVRSGLFWIFARLNHRQYVGFWLAYTLPTIVFLLCPLILLAGRNRYARSPPTGSVLASSLRLLRYAARERWSWNPVRLWKQMNAGDFWESVKPSRLSQKPAWMKFDDEWVDEVRRGFKACAVFCWFPIYCE
jgi:POT family proton-dependent oligopeptide transporter